MSPAIVNSPRWLATSRPVRCISSRHVGYASGTRNATLVHANAAGATSPNKHPIRRLSYSPVLRDDTQRLAGNAQEKAGETGGGEGAKLSEMSVPPAGPSAGGSGGGQLTTGSGAIDTLLATAVGLGMSQYVLILAAVFFGGIIYLDWYKAKVLDKIEDAFSAGYDPALELANRANRNNEIKHSQDPQDILWWDTDVSWADRLRRKDQDQIDRILHGQESGHYFLLLGPKGAGKTTMLYDAMQASRAEGVSICEAHPDLEVFRLRLGKALNFEYHEDSQTGLFQRRDPREGGPALDIERALNKLEKVALRYSDKHRRPLVLILNNIHFFNNNEEGKNILLQFQQKAEAWAASGILTIVFSSDDFWPFLFMRKTASRMHVLAVKDLNGKEALHATVKMRMSARRSIEQEKDFKTAISIVGGRLAYLTKIAKSPDMLGYARHMLEVEKAWLTSQIGLIPDHDDDVMDEQKWSSCSWLLLREFVKMRQADEEKLREQIDKGEKSPDALLDLPLPRLSYYRCRQVMTRTDFLEDLDRANIIAMDINHDVTPDSELLLHAAREVVEEEGFDEQLDDVRDRVDEIESLHRTRELTFKDVKAGDRIRLSVDKGGALLVEDVDSS